MMMDMTYLYQQKKLTMKYKVIFSEKGKVMQTTYNKHYATEKEIIDWFGLNDSDIDWFKIEIDNE